MEYTFGLSFKISGVIDHMMRKQKPSSNKRWHGGKGSTVKPYDKNKFNENFDKIFGSKKKEKEDANKTKGKPEDKG